MQTKGRWAGKPLAHELWERQFLDELFLLDATGKRVYKEALLGISRKNGKSTLGAELALYGLLGTPEYSPEVYAAAAARDQARIVFNQSKDFVEASPRLRDWLTPHRNVITCKSNKGIYRVLSSDAGLQYGLNPSMVVIDELWAHANGELYYALTTGQLARESPLVVSITTAGFDRSSICFDLYERGKRLRDDGGIDAMRAAGFLFWWYEMDPTVDYRDSSHWKDANPSSWIPIDALPASRDRVPEGVFVCRVEVGETEEQRGSSRTSGTSAGDTRSSTRRSRAGWPSTSASDATAPRSRGRSGTATSCTSVKRSRHEEQGRHSGVADVRGRVAQRRAAESCKRSTSTLGSSWSRPRSCKSAGCRSSSSRRTRRAWPRRVKRCTS